MEEVAQTGKEGKKQPCSALITKVNQNQNTSSKPGEIHTLVKAEGKGLHRPGKGYPRMSSNQTVL